MAPVGSAGGAAKYYAADNYYTMEESAEESIWYGEGAELLGLAPGKGAVIDIEAEADQGGTDQDKPSATSQEQDDPVAQGAEPFAAESEDLEGGTFEGDDSPQDASDGTDKPLGDEDVPLDAGKVAQAGSETDSGAGSGEPQEDFATSGEAKGLDSASPTDTRSDGTVPVAFNPESIAGTRDIINVEVPVPFDPDRPGGLPEGVRAPAPDTRYADKLPLSNPDSKVDASTFENILNGK
jgi:hypothetical protein